MLLASSTCNTGAQAFPLIGFMKSGDKNDLPSVPPDSTLALLDYLSLVCFKG